MDRRIKVNKQGVDKMKSNKKLKCIIWGCWFVFLAVLIGITSLIPIDGSSKYQICSILIELLILSLLWIISSKLKTKNIVLRWMFIFFIVIGFYFLNVIVRVVTYDIITGKEILESGKAGFLITVLINEIVVVGLARYNVPQKIMMLVKDLSDSTKIEDVPCEIKDNKLIFSNDYFFVKGKEMVVMIPFKNRMLLIDSNLYAEISEHYKRRTVLDKITNAEDAFNKTAEKSCTIKIVNNTIDLNEFCNSLDLDAKFQFKQYGDFYVIDFIKDEKKEKVKKVRGSCHEVQLHSK